jgi:hypothetical protein
MLIQQILMLLAAGSPASSSTIGRMLDERREAANAARLRINEWVRTSPAPQFGLLPTKFAERLRILVDTPQSLRQGYYSWCLPAAFLNSALRRFPDKIVDFALDLYATGRVRLGNLEVQMSSGFLTFDFPAEMEKEYQKQLAENESAREVLTRSRDIFLKAHADWLLLAGIEQLTRPTQAVTGSISEAKEHGHLARGPSGIPALADDLVNLFRSCGLYASATKLSDGDKQDKQKLVAALSRAKHEEDVCLLSGMHRFIGMSSGGHAVRLVEPPIISPNTANTGSPEKDEDVKFKFWSFGFKPGSIDYSKVAFDDLENAFTFAQTRETFGRFLIVRAVPKST